MKLPLRTHIQPLLFLFLFAATTQPAWAQDADSVRALADQQVVKEIGAPDSLAGWNSRYKLGISLSQASFTSNWAGGGVNSIAVNGAFDGTTEYRRNRLSWVSQLVAEYGIINTDGQGLRKTADRLLLDSKVARKIGRADGPWAIFGAVNVLTQFDVGYTFGEGPNGEDTRTPISRFLAPGFITESFGLEYRPVQWFSARIGAATLRQTLVLDTSLFRGRETYFGVTRGDRVRNEAGFWITADLNRDFNENFNLTAKLSAFGRYENLETIDTRLDMLATAKVWKRITVTLGAAFVYFRDVVDALQISQTLGIGLLFEGKSR